MNNILLLLTFLITASSFTKPIGYLIFQFEGDIHILSGGREHACRNDYQLHDQDTIQIRHGWITLIDGEVRRVTLNKAGMYTPELIKDLFTKAKESRENKFLSYLYKKMNAETAENNSQKGGVVRDERNTTFPADSSIVLSDTIQFRFMHGGDIPVHFILKDLEGHTWLETNTSDSTIYVPNNFSHSTSMVYLWSVQFANQKKIDRFFIIPDAGETQNILGELNFMRQAFPDLPGNVRDEIINEYIIEKKLVID